MSMWFKRASYEVICIGSASQDIFFPTHEGIIIDTPEDMTAKQKIAFELGGKYKVKDRYEAIGGVAANVACGLARLGHHVAAYSCVGSDQIGRFILHAFETEGVATELVTRLPGAKTDLSAIIVMTQNGERTIFHNRDANDRLQVVAEKLQKTKWLFVSALNGDWQKNLTTIGAAQASYGLKLALNPGQHNIKEGATIMLAFLPSVHVLLLNKDEATELLLNTKPTFTNEELESERFLLTRLHEAGAQVVALTDGKRGAWAYDGTEYWFCPIHTRSSVVDSTGAGDAFGSGFMAAYIAGKSVAEALQYGMANSGSVIGAYGAIDGLLSKTEVETMVPTIVPERLQ